MGRNQFLALCAVAFCGCYLGGFSAQIGPARAMAQLQQVPPGQPGQVPNIRNNDVLFIPDGGLRMVTGQNRTVGWIAMQNEGAALILLNRMGRPGISLAAGSAGEVWLNSGTNPGLRIDDASRDSGLSLVLEPKGGSLRLRDAVALTAANDGGRLLLKDGKNNNAVRLDSTPEGGRLTGFDNGQATKFELLALPTEGVFSLLGADREAGFQAGGNGSASVTKAKASLWKVPKD